LRWEKRIDTPTIVSGGCIGGAMVRGARQMADTSSGIADSSVTISMRLPARLDDGAATIAIAGAGHELPAVDSPAGGPARHSAPRYAVVGHAGRGGMAVVHVAHDLELLRTVALKQLAQEIAGDEDARLRFLREVQITAQLDHPHIVPVYGLEVAPDGAPAYAMKFVNGRTLEDLLADARAAESSGSIDERSALSQRLEHFLKVCDAVDYAHAKGVIHRDLKPANVMIGPHNEIYVMDWGICRLFSQDEPEFTTGLPLSDASGDMQTEVGSVIGTPCYMSPEQAQGRSDLLGPRSDQCALGLILAELATLRAPYDGNTLQDVLVAAANGRRRPLLGYATRRPLPRPLCAIIERATALDPDARYASVRALADDLRRYQRGDAVQAMPDTLWQRAQRYVGRHRQQMLLSLVGLVAIAAMGFVLLLQQQERDLRAQQFRELRVRDLIDRVARQGDELQLRLLRLQGELDALATAAGQLLLHGAPVMERIYWDDDFVDPARVPPDFGAQPGFDFPVSLERGVWRHPADVPRAAVVDASQRLYGLRGLRNELFDEARRTFGGQSDPGGVAGFVIALESGLSMHYPGQAVDAAMTDVRRSEWYRASLGSRGARWGDPYAAADGAVLVPLSEPLANPDGAALGVAVMELSLDYVLHNLVAGDDSEGVTVLLDAAGRVLATADGTGSTRAHLQLQPFEDPALLVALGERDIGAFESHAFGRPQKVVFDRIHPIGWILVRRVDSSTLRERG
jgi:eukaryotic-like serine/threonine-protein kinase